MKQEKINIIEKFRLFDEYWSPKLIGQMNDHCFKAVKIKDEFIWHHHEKEDEVFLVIKGEIVIKFRDQDLRAKEGEMIIIPKGVEHCPVAKDEAWVLVIEPSSVVNTGNAGGERTREVKKI